MNKNIRSGLMFCGLLLAPWLHAETPVEVTLVDLLDEPRGFCLDTLGDDGMHAHTCESYQGQLEEDQAYDVDMMADGTFRLIEFDLCMAAPGRSAGSMLSLQPCDGRDTQRFEHRSNGKIVSLAAPGNCVTVGAGPSRNAGGGTPIHLIRDLTLEVCDGSRDDRQQWRLRMSAD